MKMVRKKKSKLNFLFWLIPLILIIGISTYFLVQQSGVVVPNPFLDAKLGDSGSCLRNALSLDGSGVVWGCIPMILDEDDGTVWRGDVLEETQIGDTIWNLITDMGCQKKSFYKDKDCFLMAEDLLSRGCTTLEVCEVE